MNPFHLAFAVTDIPSTRHFYAEVLGCSIGRSAARWVDFDLFGHQLSAHLQDSLPALVGENPVDGDQVPIPHFGVVLDMQQWQALADRLVAQGIEFLIGPRIRFAGKPGEQGTFFVRDPSGNALEFKGFADHGTLFSP